MNLSIFNFNKMARIILIFLVLFVLYNVYLLLAKPEIIMYQNPQQQNESFAQDFMYDIDVPKVIVGSSIAERMKNEYLSKNIYNLSFIGGSVLTGLDIIKKSGKLPKIIYVETNMIFRSKDNNLLNRLFNPYIYSIKKYLVGMREKYQPLNLIGTQIKILFGKTHEEKMNTEFNQQIFKQALLRHFKSYSTEITDYERELFVLKELVAFFEQKDVKILFFEVPIDSSLANSIKWNTQKQIIKINFNNEWLSSPIHKKYQTTDGIHLLPKSAFDYTKKFLKEVDNEQ